MMHIRYVLLFTVAAAGCAPAETAPEATSRDVTRVASSLIGTGKIGRSTAIALARGERPRVAVLFAESRGTDPASRRRIHEARTRLAALAGSGFVIEHAPSSVPMLGGRGTVTAIERLVASPMVRRVDAAPGGSGGLAEAVRLSGFDVLQRFGFDGTGASVAVVDTGFDSDHPDLQGALVDEACFCEPGCCPDGSSAQLGPGSAEDDHWHGTFVSGVIASQGAQAPIGAAPGASIVAVKLLDSQNRFTSALQIVDALDWLVSSDQSIQAVNLSLGTDALFSGECDTQTAWAAAIFDAVANLNQRGVTVVASSQNNGAVDRIAAPACLSNVVSVGSYIDSGVQFGQPADDSNTSDVLDLYAPGELIESSGVGGGRRFGSGTSFAAPQVAACAAILHAERERTPEVVLELLKLGNREVVDPAGRVFVGLDCAAAIADGDVDGDGVVTTQDNCPAVANPQQVDSDNDGEGDACERAMDDPPVNDPPLPPNDPSGGGCVCVDASTSGAWLVSLVFIVLLVGPASRCRASRPA